MKRCAKCGELKACSDFTKHARRRDGLQPFCNSCQRAAVRQHYRRERDYYLRKAAARNSLLARAGRDLLAQLKAVPCADCGRRYPSYVMHFDHVNGQKRFDVGNGVRLTRAEIMAEVSKCEVVCANCYADRTFRRMTVSS